MIKSMTAFSKASNIHDTIMVDISIRSYNSRYLDIVLYCPEFCYVFEDDIKKLINKTHDRGRIEIRLNIRDDAKDLDQFKVDDAKAVSYYQALEKIKKDLNLSSKISLDNVLSDKDVIIPLNKEIDTKTFWDAILPCIEAASTDLSSMRKKEGKNLYLDLTKRIDHIEKSLKSIEKDTKKIPALYKKKLMEKIGFLTSDVHELDPVRIAQEAAILADKSDVSEEITRLYSHIKQFRQILDSKESQGRKLNFLTQEFNREFNTIGSKAGDASLSHMIVDLKSELEKIREQVQNIE